ncbi:hypothetical protein DERP_009569, partial [Dermatophagoides pteronyssinus]
VKIRPDKITCVHQMGFDWKDKRSKFDIFDRQERLKAFGKRIGMILVTYMAISVVDGNGDDDADDNV